MIRIYRRYRLVIVNIVYWFLVLYIVAILIWWYIELGRQNTKMAQFEMGQVRSAVDSTAAPAFFASAMAQVEAKEKLRNLGYLGEGITSLVIIFISAGFVFRVVRRQIRHSDQQQNFMMAVTHELKTPIAVAKLNLETLIKRKLTEEQQAKLINSALVETERLNQLSNNILLASRLEDSAYVQAKETVSLTDLLSSVTASFTRRFQGRILESVTEPGITIEGDALLLELAINNLIENAYKYSPKDSPVSVRLWREGTETHLEVTDEGDGIPDDEKSMIFRKFYRVGSEETRKTKGSGLGLYLSKTIIRRHRGKISVKDNQPKGSVFTITFYH
jgi:two-component system sensor histidine kinase CiaH